ncbi:hypothetical protein LZQ00_14650 [Sphingobacterium sp. SRCM116780]|uniref:hypothetical protein n=1 Tax=Sphingobacterium sp. SRCM116780 TaxID=2907623 RepID=UPI001F27FD4E|nr:hypothetical protein [Sphingobacterium sp. SRCM116780]UIR55499.1 hypothetical protein LZQ00_14650 [Sphingobacterium sp. SRCM116780]
MDEKRLTIQLQIRATLFCLCIFSLVYNGSAYYASTLAEVPSFVFSFERHIPFIPWMIIPYMSSGLFFSCVCFLCTSRAQLMQYIKRVAILTIISGIFFLLIPLQFSYPKPSINSSLLHYFFDFLNTWDSPYNQAPSLHVGYACLFWSVLKERFSGIVKFFFGCWFILLGISTMTVYQHHFIDVITALILVQIVFIFTFYQKVFAAYRNQYVACFYYLFSFITCLLASLCYDLHIVYSLGIIWISMMLFIVGLHYQYDQHHFLKDKNGHITWWKKVFYFPYQFTYYLLWRFFRKKQENVLMEIMPQLFITARLINKQVADCHISKHDHVYDLAAELEENKTLKQYSMYHAFPMLDIGTTSRIDLEDLVNQIALIYEQRNPKTRIIIHCTMGYSRSTLMGVLLLKKILSLNLNQAIALMQEKNKNSILHAASIDLLK